MFKTGLNKTKTLFQTETIPIDLTALSDSTESRKKQPYSVLTSHSLPTFAQDK